MGHKCEKEIYTGIRHIREEAFNSNLYMTFYSIYEIG